MPADITLPDAHPGKGQLKGWHALIWFLGFFGFMFVVNGIFLWTAIATFPGEDVDKSYLAGLDFNEELARRGYQAEAGWTAAIGLVGERPDLKLSVRLATRDGEPLTASSAQVQLRHPANRNLDQTLQLTRASAGRYEAQIPVIAAGVWTAHLSADIDQTTDGMELRATKVLEIP